MKGNMKEAGVEGVFSTLAHNFLPVQHEEKDRKENGVTKNCYFPKIHGFTLHRFIRKSTLTSTLSHHMTTFLYHGFIKYENKTIF